MEVPTDQGRDQFSEGTLNRDLEVAVVCDLDPASKLGQVLQLDQDRMDCHDNSPIPVPLTRALHDMRLPRRACLIPH